MSADIEAELRAAFELASDPVVPRPGLDNLVRRAARRRRRALAAAAALVGAGASVGGYLLVAATASPSHGGPPPVTKYHHAVRQFTTSGGGDAIAVDSRMIYVATGDHPGAALNAYSRATGRLVRSVGIPAVPSALRIGPDGSVWVAFYPDQNGGGTGVWRLSPDLAMRSGINLGARQYFGAAPFDVLVTSADTAVLGTDHGLAVLRLPTPGQSGRAILRWRRVSPAVRQGFPTELFPLAGRVAVLWVTDAGRHAISFAGRARPDYSARASSVAVEANGLWLTTSNLNGTPAGTLIRLDAGLRVVTPAAITQNPVLAHPTQVWATGTTVWILTAGSRSLACFSYRGGRASAVGVVHTSLPVAELAATGGTVYVVNSIGVASYAIPAACR
jgi:hypothetical protein